MLERKKAPSAIAAASQDLYDGASVVAPEVHPRSKFDMQQASISLVAAVLVTGFMGWTSYQSVRMGWLACVALLVAPLHSFLTWRSKGGVEAPFFALFGFAVWLFFVPVYFWLLPSEYGALTTSWLTPDNLDTALYGALLGVVCVWAGFHIRITLPIRAPAGKEIEVSSYTRGTLYLILLAGLFLDLNHLRSAVAVGALSEIVSQIATVLPLVALGVLTDAWLMGRASRYDRLVVVGFIVGDSIANLGSGYLGTTLPIFLVPLLLYVTRRRRLPVTSMLIVLALFAFLELGKSDFRATYWSGAAQATALANDSVSRVVYWAEASASNWAGALADPSGQPMHEALSTVVSRLDLLGPTADVMAQTPSPVPYQEGSTYGGAFLDLIPRAVWPDKPSAQSGNLYFETAYGWTYAGSQVSVAYGLIAEGFMNFGWVGIILAMLAVGILYRLIVSQFLGPGRSGVMQMLGVVLLALLPTGIGEQMGYFLTALVHAAVVGGTFFFLLDRLERRRRERGNTRLASVGRRVAQ